MDLVVSRQLRALLIVLVVHQAQGEQVELGKEAILDDLHARCEMMSGIRRGPNVLRALLLARGEISVLDPHIGSATMAYQLVFLNHLCDKIALLGEISDQEQGSALFWLEDAHGSGVRASSFLVSSSSFLFSVWSVVLTLLQQLGASIKA